MRTTFDFSPLFRSSIGFDRMLDALEAASRVDTIDNWPPYDITKTGDDRYRIAMVVAGFAPDDLSVTREHNLLTISGRRSTKDSSGEPLHRGIAARDFQRRFELADYVEVVGANLLDGILTIELERELPEAMKPRRIEVTTGRSMPAAEQRQPKQIESEQKVAAVA